MTTATTAPSTAARGRAGAVPAPATPADANARSARAGATPALLTVRSGTWEVDVLPTTGAALAAGRIRASDGTWYDLLRPTPPAASGNPEKTASWPMIPWANRVSTGLLRFGDRTWQLQRNGGDRSAIHGATRQFAWSVAEQSADRAALELDTRGLVGVNFPWRFLARVEYAVEGGRLTVATTLRNLDAEPFPAGFGHHPYLRRTLVPPGVHPPQGAEGPLLEIPAALGYRVRGGLPLGPAGPLRPDADFRRPRPLGAALDDLYTGWEPGAPVRLTYGQPGVVVELRADPLYSHLMVYAPRGRAYFAVEPQTQVNDAFALDADGAAGTGTFVLEPGEERSAAFTLTVTA